MLQVKEISIAESAILLPEVIKNISHGGWREAEYQTLHFEVQQIAGPIGVGYGFEAKCISDYSRDVMCHGGSAAIQFFLSPGRWGNITLQITLKDSGGGMDTFFDVLQLQILPVNNAPFFRFSVPTVYADERQDTCCDWFILHNFVESLSLGPWEDAGAAECNSEIECELQQGRFVVTSRNMNISSRLFEVSPRIYMNGTLVLALKVRANSELFGTATFSVTLKDENTLDSTTQMSDEAFFDIQVLAVNSPPSFNITRSLVNVDEDSGSHELLVADKIQADGSSESTHPLTDTEIDQSVTFIVSVDVGSSIFNRSTLPAISRVGILSFTLAPDAFGEAVLVVGLKDNGGVQRGGQNTWAEHSGYRIQKIVITVNPINDAPSFKSYKEKELFVPPAGIMMITGFASKISSGPYNEGKCSPESIWCQHQAIRFQIMDVTNPLLFQSRLDIDDQGTLMGTLAEEPTGYTTITFRAIDDGARYGERGQNVSLPFSTLLRLKTANQPPFFSFPWTTRCALPLPKYDDQSGLEGGLQQENNTRLQCECTPASPRSECLSMQSDSFAKLDPAKDSIPEVYGREGQVQVDFHNFAADMTPVIGTRRSASITFTEDNDLRGGLKVASVTEGGRSEYSVSSAKSPDGRHLYVAEATDSVAVYSMSNSIDSTWLDRRSHREDRIRFVGPRDGAEPGSEGRQLDIERFSTASSVEIEGQVIVAVACGAIDLLDALDIVRKNTPAHKSSDSIYALAMGHWDFGQRSVLSQSAYVREINRWQSCRERFSTRISPSSFAGLGKLGPAELRGPHCKENTGIRLKKPYVNSYS
jgi:hypothetical protein